MTDEPMWTTEPNGDRVLREKRPYMATVRASRVSGHAPLFDSEHKHQNYVTLTIMEAERERKLSGDWIFGGKEIIEVAMSEAQWVAMIASPNYGSGVPCTIQHIYHQQVEQPTGADDRTSLFKEEMAQTMQDAIDRLLKLRETRMTKAQQMEIDLAIQEMRSNMPFVAKSFEEHMETRKEKAKADIEAHMTNAVQRVGLATLQNAEALTRLLGKPQQPETPNDED